MKNHNTKRTITLAIFALLPAAACNLAAYSGSLADTRNELPQEMVEVRAKLDNYYTYQAAADKAADKVNAGLRQKGSQANPEATAAAFNDLIENHRAMYENVSAAADLAGEVVRRLEEADAEAGAAGAATLKGISVQNLTETAQAEEKLENLLSALSLAAPENASPEQIEAADNAQQLLAARRDTEAMLKDTANELNRSVNQRKSFLAQMKLYQRALQVKGMQLSVTGQLLLARRDLFKISLATVGMFGPAMLNPAAAAKEILRRPEPLNKVLFGGNRQPEYSSGVASLKEELRRRAASRAR